jgi:hypothetical protein
VQPVGPATSDVSPRFCSWSNFHLRTLGASAIHTAAWHRDLAVARFLLEAGQGPDTGDDGGMTPAMVAILRLNLLTMRCVFHDGEAVRRNLVEDVRGSRSCRSPDLPAVVERDDPFLTVPVLWVWCSCLKVPRGYRRAASTGDRSARPAASLRRGC